MDVVVQARHCSVTERFRQHVEDKLNRLEKFASRVLRVEVEISKERNPRLANRSERVEITLLTKGPSIRAEAAADDRFAALDLALDKLIARLRKAADRKRIHHGSRTPMSVAEATASLAATDLGNPNGGSASALSDTSSAERAGGASASPPDAASTADVPADSVPVSSMAGIEVIGEGPLVVREKTHAAAPITLDQALYEMEMVGHDFYLFIDADSKLPSVVYRRKGYDYGVIRLESSVL